MKPGLEKADGFVGDAVHQPVLLSDTARPATGQYVFKRFRLPHAFKRIPHHCFDEIEDSEARAALVLYPIPQVLKELRLKYS